MIVQEHLPTLQGFAIYCGEKWIVKQKLVAIDYCPGTSTHTAGLCNILWKKWEVK